MTEPQRLRASVVIATRDRHADLSRCLQALGAQDSMGVFEVIVVDDGSRDPVRAEHLPPLPALRVLRANGGGPGRARNAGVSRSLADIVAFTDDDTIPPPSWIGSIIDFLDKHSAALGVEGPVSSLPWDYLYEYSIDGSGPGHFWTANVAYRRSALVAVGGFAEGAFPTAHAEDRDLAMRVSERGPILYTDAMSLVHCPRPSGYRAAYRRGLWSASDMVLERRHPQVVTFDNRLGPRWRYLIGGVSDAVAMHWYTKQTLLRSPRRLIRSLGLSLCFIAGLSVAAGQDLLESRGSRLAR